jgi:mRNA-degrading endonuclease toxin of MazEF toxin-antitoxin module
MRTANGIDEKLKKQSVNGKRDFQPGDVVIADLPFRQKPGSKARPAVVLSSLHHNRVRQDLVAVSIYGQPVAGPWDLNIEHWREAGLRKPSKSVCDNISTVFQDTLKLVGHIDPETLDEIKVKVALILELCKECDELDG